MLSIIFFAISACLFLAGLVFVFMLNFSISRPLEVRITEANGNIYVESSKNPTDNGYIFRFVSGNKEIFKESDLSVLDISQLAGIDKDIQVGEECYVSVMFKNEINGGNSRFSNPVKWRAKKYLQAPEINILNGKICWDAVEDATSYTIFYNTKGEVLTQITSRTYYDLSKLVGGEREIFVVANSSNPNIKDSNASNKKNVIIIHEIPAFESATYSKDTGELTVVSSEIVDALVLSVGDNQYLIEDFGVVKNYSNYTFTADISYFYVDGVSIYVKAREDEYNIYSTLPINVKIT